MHVNYKNFVNFIDQHFQKLPEKIQLHNGDLTEDSFKRVFGSPEARKAKNVVYLWTSDRNIPRLKGNSNIVYIGQTSRSIFKRHSSYSKNKAFSKANKQKYKDLIELYGSMTVWYLPINELKSNQNFSLREIEGQFLWWYFQNHSEYPPVNYTKTKNRNDQIIVSV